MSDLRYILWLLYKKKKNSQEDVAGACDCILQSAYKIYRVSVNEGREFLVENKCM